MRILLPTGAATEKTVRSAARGFDAEIAVSGEIASFLTPHQLRMLINKGRYDMVIISGMCTASFAQVERETGVPVYRGPRHAADLALVLPLLDTITLSRTVPADEFLAAKRADEAYATIELQEREAAFNYLVRGLKIGGTSRMKVLAEIMDAHRCEDIRGHVERFSHRVPISLTLGSGSMRHQRM